ncbi:hypothetical protein GOODEAATRI_016311, partial [Goodea atripinnis]
LWVDLALQRLHKLLFLQTGCRLENTEGSSVVPGELFGSTELEVLERTAPVSRIRQQLGDHGRSQTSCPVWAAQSGRHFPRPSGGHRAHR